LRSSNPERSMSQLGSFSADRISAVTSALASSGRGRKPDAPPSIGWGRDDLTLAETMRSLDLFARAVMPALAEVREAAE